MITESTQKKSGDFLIQLLKDWLTSEGLTGEVAEGYSEADLPSDLTNLKIFVRNQDGFPMYADVNGEALLQVGHIIGFTISEYHIPDADEDIANITEGIIRAIEEKVEWRQPVIAGKYPPWVWVESTAADVYNISEDPNKNKWINIISVVLQTPITR